ncbi:MAG: GIY-YIG nuclease family protein [Oligoflexales bacterium]|nr:GIY-YIG nuclease family protein [Oligoflexales bacterium]
MKNEAYVYILTNSTNKVLYVGVTSNLRRRILEHKQKIYPGFTQKYNVNKLVFFQEGLKINEAISMEKTIKKWSRKAKNKLVESMNPDWRDLSL